MGRACGSMDRRPNCPFSGLISKPGRDAISPLKGFTTMHKMQARMYCVCPSRLMTMTLLPGLPINPSLMLYGVTRGRYTRTMLRLRGLYSGMSYSVTFGLSSSTAPLHKRVRTAYLAALKTSDEPSPATCEKTTEEASLSAHFPSLALMDRLTIRQS